MRTLMSIPNSSRPAVRSRPMRPGSRGRPYRSGSCFFKNIRVYFLGSDDFPPEAKAAAARDLNAALAGGWPGFEIAHRFALAEIVEAHKYLEEQRGTGRVVLLPTRGEAC